MVKTYDRHTVYNKGDVVAIPCPSSSTDKQGVTKVSHSLKFYLALTNVPTFKDPTDKANSVFWELISLAAVTADGIDVSAITSSLQDLETRCEELETKLSEVLAKFDALPFGVTTLDDGDEVTEKVESKTEVKTETEDDTEDDTTGITIPKTK